MHVPQRAWRSVIALALVAFALPLASTTSQLAQAQTAGFPPDTIGNVAAVAPAVAFNPIGTEHTVTFTCGALAGVGTAALAPGCYDVTATATDITTGSAATITSATCGGVAAGSGSGTVDCSGVASPICPTGTGPGTAPTAAAPCTGAATPASSTATVTINPGAPHAYVIQFSGYIPTTPAGSCPTGTTYVPSISLRTTVGSPPVTTVLPAGPACRFAVAAQKKYVEVTNITIVASTPGGGPCGGTLVFAEGLKSFFGPSCVVSAIVTGTVIIKTGINCTDGSEPANGSAAPAEFGPYATYSCTGDTLSVIDVTGPGNASLPGVSLDFTGGGVGSATTVGTLGGFCAGAVGATTSTVVTSTGGAAITLCPTGPGTASIQACLTNSAAHPLPNNQPAVCSNTISFAFTQTASRVVPYVRWSGEKIQLTKCFGVGLAGNPVEFVLKGNNPGLNATLLPATLTGTGSAPINGFPPADTIWTTTDSRGCATVLGLADGEGAMYVDAAIYNASAAGIAAGTPIVNEHAFDVFYLKFDHLDLENIKFTTYSTAQALQPYLTWAATTPAFNAATAFNSSFTLPGPPGSGSVAGGGPAAIPLCAPDFVRAMVHGYFEISGDPSGRPAATVAITGAPAGSAGSYTLPAGRWVLPEDWPLLATFAGFNGSSPLDITPSSVMAWDLNSGWVFNPTGESPVFCGLASGVLSASAPGLLLGRDTGLSSGPIPVGPLGNSGRSDIGPCFGQDATMLGSTAFYGSAPGSLTPAGQAIYGGNCVGGSTAGFGPFDATRACTDPFPLQFTPAGASIIGITKASCGVTPIPCLAPVYPDSTYLPNGTLNEWDAPMPPAQISFGITSGPGYLGQVNKTGLYQIRFDQGTPTCPSGLSYVAGTGICANATTGLTSLAACPKGYTIYLATDTCQLEIDPNPFYAEAIPASPLIPPVTNNGGYLWNSFGFSAGTTTIVSSTPAFAGVPAGGFVPGQSTSVTVPATATCPAGFTYVAGPPATCVAAPYTGTAVTCAALGGTYVAGPPATCTLAAPAAGTLPGGVNLTDFGTACAAGNGSAVVVADGRGFMPGMSVEVYASPAGATITAGGVITAVLPSPRTVNGVSYPNAVELQFSTPYGGCLPAFTAVVIAQQFGLPVPGAAAFTVGELLTVGTPGGKTDTSTVTQVDTTNNIVYIAGAETVALTFGACTLSRPTAGSAAPLCEPNVLVPPGTVINSGPVGTASAEPTALYPFWQWVPAAPAATDTPTTGTVYSDNHGEAVVSLNTAIASQIAPVNNACPAPYGAIVSGTTVVTCLLPFSVLGKLGFGNVASALSRFSASTPGCIQTFPSGTTAVLSGTTVGATGPAAGQICVNALGGIEFGAAAALGTTTVQAVADYPYTRGEHPPIASAPLVKVFTSAFAKTLTVSAGSPGPAGTTSYLVTITATDVCGNPITGEPIQVYALGNAGAVVLAPVSVGAVLQANANSAVVTVRSDTGTATLSLEVLNTAIGTQGLVIKAVFPFEAIERFATVISGTTPGQTATVVYAPGWQQIGGPAGSNFSVVEALFSWDAGSQSYANATAAAGNLSSAAPGCTGYWGYFAAAMAVSLPATSHSGDTAVCSLKAGWNLVGNPFATPATLPSGTTAYHWNGTSYDTVATIPTGGSVWVFNDGTLNSLTVTAT